MNTNNSSGSKKLLSSDSRKPRPTILTAAIVSKLMTMLLEHFFFPFACLHCIHRVWGMMDATCCMHLLWFINVMQIEDSQSDLCPHLCLQNQNFQKRKLNFFCIAVSITPLCSYVINVTICWLFKGDAQLMLQVPADSLDVACSFSLLTVVIEIVCSN